MAMKQNNLPAIVPELFEHEQFGNFRYIKRGEEILFVGVDLCRALGYTNPQKALRDHVPDKYKNTVTIRSGIPNELGERIVRSGQRRKVIVVSEPGLYRLIMRSNLPAAEKFMDWVCEEVLPSIRKYGFYGLLNGEQARQLPIGQYLSYLGKLTTEQYMAYLRQLTTEQYFEHYARLEERIPYMTEEEKLNLPDDPDIIVMRFQNEKKWRVKIYV